MAGSPGGQPFRQPGRLLAAGVGQVQARRPAGEHLAGAGRGAVADQQHQGGGRALACRRPGRRRLRRGRHLLRQPSVSGMKAGRHGCRPRRPGAPRGRDRGLPGLSPAGRLAGGGGGNPPGRLPATRSTGPDRFPASATPTASIVVVGPGPRRPRRATERGGCSPGTAPATGCIASLYRAGLANQPTSVRAATTVCASTACG